MYTQTKEYYYTIAANSHLFLWYSMLNSFMFMLAVKIFSFEVLDYQYELKGL